MSAASETAAAPAAPAAAAEVPPLEAAMNAYAATSPEDAKLLMERIAEIKQREEAATKRLASLEERKVDVDVLRDQLGQLQAYLASQTVKQYHVAADTVAAQLASDKPSIVANAAQRVVAACNAHFMSMNVAAEEPRDAKRARKASAPAAAPPAAPAAAPAVEGIGGSDALRRALAARYA